jgi:hypothetical protein
MPLKTILPVQLVLIHFSFGSFACDDGTAERTINLPAVPFNYS